MPRTRQIAAYRGMLLCTFCAIQVKAPAEKLFALMMLGDDRAVEATYVMGELAYPAAQKQ